MLYRPMCDAEWQRTSGRSFGRGKLILEHGCDWFRWPVSDSFFASGHCMQTLCTHDSNTRVTDCHRAVFCCVHRGLLYPTEGCGRMDLSRRWYNQVWRGCPDPRRPVGRPVEHSWPVSFTRKEFSRLSSGPRCRSASGCVLCSQLIARPWMKHSGMLRVLARCIVALVVSVLLAGLR